MAGLGFGEPATQTGAFRTEDTQFTGAEASQLDPTAHGADYGFLDFTQQEPAGDELGSGYQFSYFSQVQCQAHLLLHQGRHFPARCKQAILVEIAHL